MRHGSLICGSSHHPRGARCADRRGGILRVRRRRWTGTASTSRSPTPVTAARARANFGRSRCCGRCLAGDDRVRALPARGSGSGRERHAALASRSPGRARYAVRRVEDNEWRERRLTYATAPHPSLRFASSRPVRRGAWSAVDVTSFVAAAMRGQPRDHDMEGTRSPAAASRNPAPPRREDRRRRTEQPRPRRDPPR